MQKSLFLLQFLACVGLTAQSEVAAKSSSEVCATKSTAMDTTLFMRGDTPLTGNMAAAAYSYPANISLSNGWDLYGNISYILWYTQEEGLDLAASGYIYEDELWEPAKKNGTILFQDANYTSGFKIGLGANLNVDDWVVDLSYTYLRQQTNTNSGVASAPDGETPAFNVSGWFQNNYYGGQDVALSFTSKWKVNLDWLDLQFSRPYYQGRRLVVTPSAGLRASWIRQQLHIFSPYLHNAYEFATPVKSASGNYSKSWAIGPRALVDMRWLVAGGFRFEGNVGGSLLFTQFSRVSHRESTLSSSGTLNGGVEVSFSNYNCLRTMAEANLGIGWGSYLYAKKYHIDFSAMYDFNYLWSQNMMRYLLGANSALITGAIPGDLVLHGLELKGRFDF